MVHNSNIGSLKALRREEQSMSLKRKNRVVPVMMKDIVGGQAYIRIGVTMHGHMWFEPIVLVGHPSKNDEGGPVTRKLWKIQRHNPFVHFFGERHTEEFVASLGMDPDMIYNYHRTFRYTTKSQRILQDLVSRQALSEYLRFIGFQNPTDVIAQLREQCLNSRFQWSRPD